MDSSRTQGGLGSKKRRRESPLADTLKGPPTQQTSLPSIRHLHPNLPPLPGHSSSDYGQGYFSASSHLPPPSGQVDSRLSEEYEDADERDPPKKKRRRQPLSCTECQRRKIKCDRIQPCTPCSSRGEETICKWAIVEPLRGKYATTEEIDDLKARVEQLAALVRQVVPDSTPGLPYFRMGLQSTIPVVGREPLHSGTSTPSEHLYLMPSPPQFPQRQQPYSKHSETSYSESNVCMNLTGVRFPTHAHCTSSSSSPIILSTLHDPSLPQQRPENTPTSAAAAVKAVPLSLTSVASPYRQEESRQSQLKDLQGQALIPGKCLRPTNLSTKTPVASERQQVPC